VRSPAIVSEPAPSAPLAIFDELELAAGATRRFRTVMLRGGRCPEHCVFCNLPSLGEATALSAPRARVQIEAALPAEGAPPWGIKLYNGSSFFEPRSIEPAAQKLLLERAAACERIVVESRPEFAAAARSAADRWPGKLEVALGLEVADDAWVIGLGKRTTASAYFAAARELREAGVQVRAFVLLGLPGLTEAAALQLCIRTLEACAARAIKSVSILPTAATTPALQRAHSNGRFQVPGMRALFAAARRAQALGLATRIDLTFQRPLPGCDVCRAACDQLNAAGVLPEPSCRCAAS
jgi:radical SAM enzyme (TIGR01210 family)